MTTEPWVTNWLTPVWLIGVGTILGMLFLLAIWLTAAGLSRIPVLGGLSDNKDLRVKAAVGLSVILLVPIAAWLVLPQFGIERTDSTDTLLESLGITVTVSVGLAILGALSIIWLSSRRTVAEVRQAVSEGALWYIFVFICLLSGFSAVATVIAFSPSEIFASTLRLPFVGITATTGSIEGTDFEELGDAKDPPQHPVDDIHFRSSEVTLVSVTSNERLTIDHRKSDELDVEHLMEVNADEESRWIRPADGSLVFETDEVDRLYIRNYGADEANYKITIMTQPRHPEVIILPMVAGFVVIVFLLYMLQRSMMPKASAIALATTKSEIAQPLFLILMIAGAVLLIIFVWIPYNTLGEDIKMLKDTGMTLIMVLCIGQAVWAASNSISDEIDGKTALTVLSKPIGRRSFIVGKFLGISWTVAVMFVLLGFLLLVLVAYKPIYDARETSFPDPTWQQCFGEMIGIIPGLALAFMEALVMAALSVAISTRLPMLGNFVICFTIYVMGNLTPLLVQSSIGQFAPVEFVANLLATVLPILDHFNIQAAIAAGKGVPPVYLVWSLVYCMIYGAIALLLALVLFEDRDLA